MIVITVTGPMLRASRRETRPDNGSGETTTVVTETAELSATRRITEPHPNLDYYDHEHPLEIAHLLAGKIPGWTLDDSDPEKWSVTITGDPETWIDCARAAAEEHDEGTTTFHVLHEWGQLDRFPVRPLGRASAILHDRVVDGEAESIDTDGRVIA